MIVDKHVLIVYYAAMEEKETIMTLQEVADCLKVSMSQIYKVSLKPDFPRLQISTFGIRVKKSDLDKWLESKKTIK